MALPLHWQSNKVHRQRNKVERGDASLIYTQELRSLSGARRHPHTLYKAVETRTLARVALGRLRGRGHSCSGRLHKMMCLELRGGVLAGREVLLALLDEGLVALHRRGVRPQGQIEV